MKDNVYFLVIVGMLGVFLLVLLMIMLQVKNQNNLLQQQQKSAAAEITHQKNLLHAIITSQETERHRIGKDLHDEVGAALSSLRLLIESYNSLGGPIPAENNFNTQSKLIIDRVITNTRNIAHNLSPRISGSFGFYDAVHELSDTVNGAGSIKLLLHFDEAHGSLSINNNTAMALYRVLSELINNTIKHAQAAHIHLSVMVENNCMQIVYEDDGTGLSHNENTPAKGMGLQNIESRLDVVNAKWKIDTQAAKGFSMQITVPLT